MHKFKTVNIKGKEYVQVNERIKYFRTNEAYKNFGIEVKWLKIDEKIAICQAFIYDQDNRLVSTGSALERANEGYINKTSHVENCETSAVGRALGLLGIGIDTSIASAEEVEQAIEQQNKDKGLSQRQIKINKLKKYMHSKYSKDGAIAQLLTDAKECLVGEAGKYEINWNLISFDHLDHYIKQIESIEKSS